MQKLTEQSAWLIIYISRNKIKMHKKYQYNRLDATGRNLSSKRKERTDSEDEGIEDSAENFTASN